MTKKLLGNTLLVLVPALICILVSEVALRFVMGDELRIIDDERVLMYAHHDSLGWFPIPNSEGTYKVEKEISIRHNSRGFRGGEHIPGEKRRMMVIGDSFVWGFDVEEEDRFTNKLDENLQDWDVFNLGISGYGTDQELMILEKNYDYYDPELVFLLYCTANDKLDNMQNLRYKHFYKPYYTLNESGELELQGVPVPKGPRYYLGKEGILFKSYIARLALKSYYNLKYPQKLAERDPTFELIKRIRDYTEERGSTFVMGLQKGYPELESFLEAEGIEYINVENEFVLGLHWTDEGHTYVANEIEDHLKKMDVFK